MKKLLTFISILAISTRLFAQAPQALNYQGLALDAASNVLNNHHVNIRLSILSGSMAGTVVYSETHNRYTDAYGLFTLQIGKGTAVSGNFTIINWGASTYYLKVEIDPDGGSNYTVTGINQFVSVPYALYAANGVSTGVNPGDMFYWNGTKWMNVPAATSNGQVLVFSNGVPTWGATQLPQVNALYNPVVTPCNVSFYSDNPRDGGVPLTASGVCWGTTAHPTVASDTVWFTGNGTGQLLAHITGVLTETHYYFRPFATNSVGTSYGMETEATTPSGLVNITSTLVSSGANSVTANVNILDFGGEPLYESGLCYSTSPLPTTVNSVLPYLGAPPATYTLTIGSINYATLYYVRPYAKNCLGTQYGTGFSFTTSNFVCGTSTLTINHKTIGMVAPVDKTVVYGTVNNIPGEISKCWITSNLGADHQATSQDDATEASAGWYWQYNQMQGYKHDGVTRTPNSIWNNQLVVSGVTVDPCALELGNGWRLPTGTEWTNVDAVGNWIDWNGPWYSGLLLHCAGFLNNGDGSLLNRGSKGNYRSTSQSGNNSTNLYFSSDASTVTTSGNSFGYSVRCIKN